MGPPPARGKRLVVKLAVALVIVTGLAFLFMYTVRGSRAQPYTIDGQLLRNWTVAFKPPARPGDAVLVLRPPPELARGLFSQVFARAMESLYAPTAEVPLLLQAELGAAGTDRLTPEALAAAARSAGMDGLTPVCLGYRRVGGVGAPRVPRQLYFVLFDATVFDRFRNQLAALLGSENATPFDPGALSPVLLIGASDTAFEQWMPLRADPRKDCLAPITVR